MNGLLQVFTSRCVLLVSAVLVYIFWNCVKKFKTKTSKSEETQIDNICTVVLSCLFIYSVTWIGPRSSRLLFSTAKTIIVFDCEGDK